MVGPLQTAVGEDRVWCHSTVVIVSTNGIFLFAVRRCEESMALYSLDCSACQLMPLERGNIAPVRGKASHPIPHVPIRVHHPPHRQLFPSDDTPYSVLRTLYSILSQLHLTHDRPPPSHQAPTPTSRSLPVQSMADLLARSNFYSGGKHIS